MVMGRPWPGRSRAAGPSPRPVAAAVRPSPCLPLRPLLRPPPDIERCFLRNAGVLLLVEPLVLVPSFLRFRLLSGVFDRPRSTFFGVLPFATCSAAKADAAIAAAADVPALVVALPFWPVLQPGLLL